MRISLAGEDAAWLHMDRPENQMVIAGLLELGRPVSREELRRVIGARLVEIPRFRQRVVGPTLRSGTPSWEEDPSFTLDAHLRFASIGGGEDELKQAIGDRVSELLPRDRPLWIVHVLEREGRGPMLLARISHAIGDGFALLGVLLSVCDDTPGSKRARVVMRNRRHPIGGAALKVGASLLHQAEATARNPVRLFELAERGTRYGSSLAKLLTLSPEPDTVLRGPLVEEKRVAWAKPRSLDRIKAVGRPENATINDVLVSAISGGLRRYLLQRGTGTGSMEIRAMVPVNLRPMDQPIELGNRFGLVVLDLDLGSKRAIDRVRETKRRMDALKRSGMAEVASAILGAMGFAPRGLESLGVRFFTERASVVLTNVVGPRDQLSIAGCPIERIMYWVPQSGAIGLGISIMSYRGEVSIAAMADALRIPDPERIIGCIEEELGELGV